MRNSSVFAWSAAIFAIVLCASVSAAAELKVHTAEEKGTELRWFEEMVPMRDGVKLYTYGILPPDGGKCGIIIVRNPYVSERKVDIRAYARKQASLLKRGYAYVYQHVRGTGMSEGDWIPYVNEREDGLALLDWVRKLPHYNGEIFLTGGSYLATVHWSYLGTNPPDVKGAVLNIQDVNRYNLRYRNGHFKGGRSAMWMVDNYKKKDKTLKRDKSVKLTDLPLKDFCRKWFGESVPLMEELWNHPRPDDPWWRTSGTAGGEFRRAHLDSTVPVMMVTGFYDIYTEGMFDMWREMPSERRANCALVVDAFDHGGRRRKGVGETSPNYFPNGSRYDEGAIDSLLDWFDWCRGKGSLKKVRPGETLWYSMWENVWRSAPEMKDARNQLELYFTSERRLVCSPGNQNSVAVQFAYDPKNPPSFPGAGCLIIGGMYAQPKPGFRKDVLSFVSEPFSERYIVRGKMKLDLTVTSDCDDTSFYVRTSICKRDGKWYTLRDDIKSISWDTSDYEPGAEAKISYALSDHAFAIEKGDRLRVDVTGANVSTFIPHTNFKGPFVEQSKSRVAHNAVLPGKCKLSIPVE